MPMIKAFEKSGAVANGVTTPWMLLPQAQSGDYLDRIMVALGPDGAGTGRFEFTAAPFASVEAEIATPSSQDDILPIAWDNGDVTANASAVIAPVTAFRVVNVSGDLFYSVRGI